jgi:hypothetical protein
MEHIPTSRTFLARQLLVSTNQRIADRALCLPFERADNISTKCNETVDKVAVLLFLHVNTASSKHVNKDSAKLTENVMTP